MVDGNEAAASVAHRTNEVVAIYPITPASPMGEHADEWSARGKTNIWGQIPKIIEMQSEAGAAGAVHGALQGGALTTTFTASQGLLLMIPNLYKIAGELSACCIHVAARAVATHALSIFGDHSDVMATRQTGFALLASSSVQEAQDFACVGQAATLAARVPFLHFFDGFRTSHEIQKIVSLSDDELRRMIPQRLVEAHHRRALNPDQPVLRGTAQNPDVFFQAREACNIYYDECPNVVADAMRTFGALTGREYRLFDYDGHPDAERAIVVMGSGAQTARATANWLAARGEKVGVISVRLYRPFSIRHFVEVLPKTIESIAVLDRTKEPGAVGDPLYVDVVSALRESDVDDTKIRIIGGRYGLSSKEFTPPMVKAVFDELSAVTPKRHFTVGIRDDVTHLSLPVDDTFSIHREGQISAVFIGLGADGTVGANKNSIKIIGADPNRYAQGYFEYDSKKSGAVTVSHLRFGPQRVKAPYLIHQASFIGCHQREFIERYDVLSYATEGATLLLNDWHPPGEVWDNLPVEVQQEILDKRLKLYAIDAYGVADQAELGRRINTIMQTCFFALSGVLPPDEAIARIKDAVRETYATKGEKVIAQNMRGVDSALEHLHRIETPAVTTRRQRPPIVAPDAPDFVQHVTAAMMARSGDLLPVSALSPDGTWPVGTSKWEKRGIALEIPEWDESLCIQCNKCVFVCPHAAIRVKVFSAEALENAPSTLKTMDYRGKEFGDSKYGIQVSPQDCTGCHLCVAVCPAKDKENPEHKSLDMVEKAPLLEAELENDRFFQTLPDPNREKVHLNIKGTQFLEPLFEYSGACAGCGETPYIKLLTQLWGDRLLIANATGCSSIFGGNLPTVPYTTNREGRGPAWSNSLFEDNAEFGLGMRLGVDQLRDKARALVVQCRDLLGDALVTELLEPEGDGEAASAAQRARVAELRRSLDGNTTDAARTLRQLADYLVDKTVWIVGGDGWAYDIGYGGLDHVLATGRNVNILVLDTEVYSNTGGQQSKATPLGAVAKFAYQGKETAKKDLGLLAMTYGNVYVAQVASGAKDAQTVRAFTEAQEYPGTSLIIAYCPCIAHGYEFGASLEHQKLAVDSGDWPLYRFDPRRLANGESALVLDSPKPKISISQFRRSETRFQIAERQDPERFEKVLREADHAAKFRYAFLEHLSKLKVPPDA